MKFFGPNKDETLKEKTCAEKWPNITKGHVTHIKMSIKGNNLHVLIENISNYKIKHADSDNFVLRHSRMGRRES